MEQYRHDSRWAQIAKWSEELGVKSWNKNVVCMSAIHPQLLMGSRLSAQCIIDGNDLCDQFGRVYTDSSKLRMICVASNDTCAYCGHSKRFSFFCVRDKEHDTSAYLEVVVAAAKLMHKFLSRNKIVLVHCHSGRNRSALVILVYCAMYTNLTYEEALFSIRKHNSSRFETQNTLKNSSFTSHVRMQWNELKKKG